MATLYISEVSTDTDDLGRWVTTLTQEVMVKVNQTEENLFVSTIRAIQEADEELTDCYFNEDLTELEANGCVIEKAVETVNEAVGHSLIAPITDFEPTSIYRVEIEY